MNEYVIQTNKVTKLYGKNRVIHNVFMKVPKGAVYGLVGQNGAGKTTLMKMITGLAEVSSGEVILFGEKDKRVSLSQRRIGLLIENPGIYGGMTAYENLKVKAIGMGVYRHQDILDILELVGLKDTGKKKAKHFSLGMKQRLGLGLALIGSPDILILDEPINGLDPQGIVEMRHLIERLNKERRITILISSHILEELYKIVSNIGIIHKGELLLELTKQEVMERCKRKLVIRTNEADKATVVLEKMNIGEYTVADNDTIYVYEGFDRISEINMNLAKQGILIREFKVDNENLEEFFMNVIQGERK